MDTRYFVFVLAATLVGGIVGRYIAERRRAKNKPPILGIHLPTRIESALLSFLVFIAIFTLVQDTRTVVGADWDLWIMESLEGKYGFLLGVILVSLGGDFMIRRNQPDESTKVDPDRNVA